jgi:hypothetical protein
MHILTAAEIADHIHKRDLHPNRGMADTFWLVQIAYGLAEAREARAIQDNAPIDADPTPDVIAAPVVSVVGDPTPDPTPAPKKKGLFKR